MGSRGTTETVLVVFVATLDMPIVRVEDQGFRVVDNSFITRMCSLVGTLRVPGLYYGRPAKRLAGRTSWRNESKTQGEKQDDEHLKRRLHQVLLQGIGLGCSPSYQQPLIGIFVGSTTIPIKDCYKSGEHPKYRVSCLRPWTEHAPRSFVAQPRLVNTASRLDELPHPPLNPKP